MGPVIDPPTGQPGSGTRRGHPAGALGVIHPFPTILVSLATVALAILAGGSPLTVALLGGGMLGFQSSIGATNDLADREEDLARGARKPIPAGQIGVPAAALVAIIGAIVGLCLSAMVGPVVLLIGALGLGCGLAYDLWLRRLGLATLAYALALPALLLYAWWGGAGTLPPGGLELLVLAALVGPGLHVANALVDVDLDMADRSAGLTVRLGQRSSVVLLVVLVTATHLLAWLMWVGTDRPVAPALVLLVSGALAVCGLVSSADHRRARRSMGWTTQAVATALLGVGLLAALAADPATGGTSG